MPGPDDFYEPEDYRKQRRIVIALVLIAVTLKIISLCYE